jgi:hypothetical protein
MKRSLIGLCPSRSLTRPILSPFHQIPVQMGVLPALPWIQGLISIEAAGAARTMTTSLH